MSQAGSSTTTAQAGQSSQGSDALTVDALVAQAVGGVDAATIAKLLKDSTPKDSREGVLMSMLSTGEDPLRVLDPEQHTLVYLHIL